MIDIKQPQISNATKSILITAGQEDNEIIKFARRSLWNKARVLSSPADGHCLLYSLVTVCKTQLLPEMNVKVSELLKQMERELVDNIGTYRAFLINSKAGYILTSFKSYAELKKYNSDFGDMVPLLAANTLGIKIVSVGIPESSSKTRIFNPPHLNKNTPTVFIVKIGDHYDGIVPMTSQFRKYSDIILGTDDSCSNG